MSLIKMEIQDPWWSHILDGRKTVEGRKGTATWSKIKVGDTLRCIEPNRGEHFDTLVTDVRRYEGDDPLFDYLTREGISKVLPGVTTITEGIAVYLQWSTPAEIRQHGMLAIEVYIP